MGKNEKENDKKDFKKIRKILRKMRKQTIVFDEDTSRIIGWVFYKKLYSKFMGRNQYYLVHIYYKSAKWHLAFCKAIEKLTELYEQWDSKDKELWMQNTQKYLNNEVMDELKNFEKPTDKNIVEIVVVEQMNTMASMIFKLDETLQKEREELLQREKRLRGMSEIDQLKKLSEKQ